METTENISNMALNMQKSKHGGLVSAGLSYKTIKPTFYKCAIFFSFYRLDKEFQWSIFLCLVSIFPASLGVSRYNITMSYFTVSLPIILWCVPPLVSPEDLGERSRGNANVDRGNKIPARISITSLSFSASLSLFFKQDVHIPTHHHHTHH